MLPVKVDFKSRVISLSQNQNAVFALAKMLSRLWGTGPMRDWLFDLVARFSASSTTRKSVLKNYDTIP